MAISTKRRPAINQGIKEIIESKNLTANFQQIVSVSRKSVIGVEGLIRYTNPDTGDNVVPSEIFAAARAEDLSLEMDRTCRTVILEEFSKVHRDNPDKILFLNMDTAVLEYSEGSGYLFDQVRQNNINPRNIVIEISEINVLSNSNLKRFVDTYKRYGFMVALDDVGTGFSNMDRILLVKPDIIKIDISLVKNIHIDFYKQGVFKSLVILANKIGALVIAEGVEFEEEAIQVLRLGSHMIQGFYFSVPEPLVDGYKLFSNNKIALLGKKFNEYIKMQNTQNRNKNKKLIDIVNRSVMKLGDKRRDDYDKVLKDIVSGCETMECAYILDSAGVQISKTICAQKTSENNEKLIFYSAKKGTDHSMEKYYYPLSEKRRKRCMTEPYVSLATGSLCITISTVFFNKSSDRCILCADFQTDEDFYNIELRGPVVNPSDRLDPEAGIMRTTMSEELITDRLTGAYNRRYIEERLPIDIYNAVTNNKPLSIILIDVDQFKNVNDRFGHLAGDQVLKEFVACSRQYIRNGVDWIARYGGDEFLIILNNASETVSKRVAESVRTACERAGVRYEDKTVRFTVSMGVYTSHRPGITIETLIRLADKNLYAAKKAGRNRAVQGICDTGPKQSPP